MATTVSTQPPAIPLATATLAKRRTPLGDAWRTLRRNPTAMAGLFVMTVWLVLAITAPVLPIQDPIFQDCGSSLRARIIRLAPTTLAATW
ncbi:MAG: hypothetical protein C4345_01360 [Chloroflexota bacterium]